MKTIIIAAMDPQRVIGKDNQLPWHLPEDLKHFKGLTSGHAIIMGRKTFDAIGKPLPKRRNYVLTQNKNWQPPEGVKAFGSLEEALRHCRATEEEKAFVIGGAQVYKLALGFADEMELTHVHGSYEGDAYFPEFNTDDWTPVDRKETEEATYTQYIWRITQA